MDWHELPFQRTRDLSCRMVAWQSVSGTSGEAAFAEKLRDLLIEIPYFSANPDDIILLDSRGEPMTRNLVAIVRGQGQRALALVGHFDTVSVGN